MRKVVAPAAYAYYAYACRLIFQGPKGSSKEGPADPPPLCLQQAISQKSIASSSTGKL